MVSIFCVMVYTLEGLRWAKSDCFYPFSFFGFKKPQMHCTLWDHRVHLILILCFIACDNVRRLKGVQAKIGHYSLWCWVTHATMFQIHVRLTSLQLPHCQVQTVQDLADLIWRTPRGLKLRTVDDETYIASLATKVAIKHMDFNSGRMVWCH